MVKRVVVAGCRFYTNYREAKDFMDTCLSDIRKSNTIIIVSGGCKGADMLGERYALESGFQVERRPAQWQKYGRSAGPKRNMEMAEISDYVICFWDGKSKGTKSMIRCAKKCGKPVRLKSYNKIKNKSSYSAYCYNCKRTFRYQDYGRYGSKVHKCSHCGFEGEAYEEGSYHYEHEMHIDVCKSGDIVFRVIKVELKAERTQLSATAEETDRIYIRGKGDAPKRDVLYYDSLGNIRYRKSGKLPNLSLDRGQIHITDAANFKA